jgi:cbb3-type cytochrome oxidase subunit 3
MSVLIGVSLFMSLLLLGCWAVAREETDRNKAETWGFAGFFGVFV